MSDERFPKQHRLLRGSDFERVYQRRRSVGDEMLVVHGCENELPHPRLGLSVSRRVGPAVVRNRWKRLIREAFRKSRDRLPPSLDLVVTPRAGVQPEFDAIRSSLIALAARLNRKLRKGKPL